ncbi:MAG: sulfurtransferase-like selenium metabolism protein YedF [Anaeromicrobium sp.]|jgi:selenium metabolism protein YedF|uniref:sulfurtransferase-like selenium metabolism protein YedF n=1 Tax=Anaeromicrobium sp. TaxID=1929132 RepID=UPI0025D77E21|nr:sulfurtransferase-like selenium metabolism protein YedF [Anaeromicrobium sp.]MCT4595231.1 sulfurtransferase-like selenium metabolism protein YedF [Anaeromicrobium sp.]
MNQEIDARGLQCPKPVIETKKVLDELQDGSIITIVDNEVAMKNVSKLAQSMAYNVEVKQIESDYHINIYKGSMEPVMTISKNTNNETVILIGNETLGQGAEELGKILMKGYIYTITEYDPYPKSILFINSGVKLTIEGSEVIDYLRALEKEGVEILSCGTCLDYYKIKDKLAVGGVTNMYTIVDTLHSAKNKVTL